MYFIKTIQNVSNALYIKEQVTQKKNVNHSYKIMNFSTKDISVQKNLTLFKTSN